METSAKTSKNVVELFTNAVKLFLKKTPNTMAEQKIVEEIFHSWDNKQQPPKRDKPLELPATYTLPAHYQELVLSRQMLKSVPAWIFTTSVLLLDLSENRLTDIPQCISEAKALRKLFVQKNQLTQLPQALSLLKELRVFKLFCSVPTNAGFKCIFKQVGIASKVTHTLITTC